MLRDYLRSLTVATLAVPILALPGADTYFRPKPPGGGGGARCAYFNRDFNEWDFSMPGDLMQVRDANGNWVTLRCSSNGTWVVVPNLRTGPTHSAGGGVMAPSVP